MVANEVGRRAVAIHHVGISVGNLERSLAFYRDLLGFDVIGLSTEEDVGQVVGIPGARARFADLDAGNGQLLELIEYRTATDGGVRPANTVGSSHLSLRVTDVEDALAALADAGIVPIGETASLSGGVWEGCTVVYVRDPDGMIVELIEQRTDG